MTNNFKAGDRFGMLVVESFHDKDKHGRFRWKFKCDCGNTTIAMATKVKAGRTKSCGCYRKSRKARLRHGHKSACGASPVYQCWVNMKRRCKDKKLPGWKDYGGRGITYDPIWEEFDNFLSDMGEPPFEGAMLDRIDNDGPYCKENCRWVTRKRQNRNKRNVRLIKHEDKEMSLPDWADYLGLNLHTLYFRFRRGWSAERALTAGKFHKSGKFTPSPD